MDMLNEPVRVWHLIVVMAAFGFAPHSMQRQMSATGKCVVDMWEKFLPYKRDDL